MGKTIATKILAAFEVKEKRYWRLTKAEALHMLHKHYTTEMVTIIPGQDLKLARLASNWPSSSVSLSSS